MKNRWITAVCLLIINTAFAQNAHFVTSGVIEYSKTANMYVIIDKMFDKNSGVYAQDPVELYKKAQPQFRTVKSTLVFGDNKTLFTPIGEQVAAFTGIATPMADQYTTRYTDLSAGNYISEKTTFETTLLVKDNVSKINWKITNETREIAGYHCRRANALVLDSVYIVAFYTDKIHVRGGPEGFGGLPGMILQLAIPHENISWVATSVTEKTITPTQLKPPVKGREINNTQLYDFLKNLLKNRGDKAAYYLKAFML